ncbi:ShlB/FhaC/HecB family hemolysin secretion/activation protein [Glaesserella sp.]|uniref:ShlB/FhaC/HecB family hemolysin secretion/activation protein n=1 Tax=Glaesserella sp. TaxID=2094731 RepID=UPI0035A077D7
MSKYILAVLPFFTFVSLVNANTLADLAGVDAQQQQRQLQQTERQLAHLKPEADVRLDITEVDESLRFPVKELDCYSINQIDFVDYQGEKPPVPSRFSRAYQKVIADLKLKLPHCFGGEGINIFVKRIQNEIIRQGYITTQVIVPDQDINTGKLTLMVVPGKLRNIFIEDNSSEPRFSRFQAWNGMALQKGDVLQLRDLEQSLENFKRLPTVEANIDIIPSTEEGAEIGDSDVKVSYEQRFPIRLNIGLDDGGSKSTGKWQAYATFAVDNLLSANDLFYTYFMHSIKRNSDEPGKRSSRNLLFYYSIPFRDWLLSLSYSDNRYDQRIYSTFNNDYLYEGNSRNGNVTLSRLLYRDNQRKTYASFGVWSRKSYNYIDDVEIAVQRRKMSGWEAGIVHKEFWGNSSVEVELGYKRGTGANGSLRAPEEAYGEGTSRPQILFLSLAYTKPFKAYEQDFLFNSRWEQQWSFTPLIAQDQFSIGGRYTVRGFDGERYLAGNRGWLWRNDVSWFINHSDHAFYVALDAGDVRGTHNRKFQNGHHLVGSVAGFRGYWKGLNYDYFVGAPIHKPQGFQTSRIVTGFSVGYSF